jgi:hypothetical protein
MLHSKGHGYDNPTIGDRKPCTAFDGLKPIANPLGGFSDADRERRAFYPEGGGTGVTYGSHSLQLGIRDEPDREADTPRQAEIRARLRTDTLFLMMSHGGGREVYSMRNGVYHVPILEALLALPEREQYSLLYSIWDAQQETRRQAIEETAKRWAQAFADGRIRKRRNGRVEIESEWEAEARKARRARRAA